MNARPGQRAPAPLRFYSSSWHACEGSGRELAALVQSCLHAAYAAGALGFRAALAAAGEGLAGKSFPFLRLARSWRSPALRGAAALAGGILLSAQLMPAPNLKNLLGGISPSIGFALAPLGKRPRMLAMGSSALKGMLFFGGRGAAKRRRKRADRAWLQ